MQSVGNICYMKHFSLKYLLMKLTSGGLCYQMVDLSPWRYKDIP